MTYSQTLDFLFSQLPMYQRQGAAAYKTDLNNTIALSTALKDPHKSFLTIHVAGTNGKGSVSHMLASILQEAGYKTGLYTSPHYKDFRERIKVNGKIPSRNYVVKFVQENRAIIKNICPSFFELTVVMAFDYFRQQKVDIAVIETGMGGRLDSTNIIHPEISIITNISMDHTDFLGKTLRKIAGEKAGIIKAEVPVVVGRYQASIADVFKKKAKVLHAKLYFAAKSIFIEEQKSKYRFSRFINAHSRSGLELKSIKFPLAGDYQIENLKTVLKSCEILSTTQLNISKKAIRLGIQNVKLNTSMIGRFDIINKDPLIIVDGAHNEDGLKQVLDQLNEIKARKMFVVFGLVNDKDLSKILPLLPKEAYYFWCKAGIPRALDPEILNSKAINLGLRGESCKSVTQALRSAQTVAQKDDLIFVGGSIFVAAEVL